MSNWRESMGPQGAERVEGVHGERYIGGGEVRFGDGIEAHLYTVTEQPVDAASLVESVNDGAEDRALTPAEQAIMETYGDENWVKASVDGREFSFPMAPLVGTEYFDHPERVDSMEVVVLNTPFEIHPKLAPFRDELVARAVAGGRNLTNGAVVSVAGYDPALNRLTLRECGYHDVYVTSTYGADMRLETQLDLEGRSGESLREIAGLGKLPELSEDALVTNSFGLGGIVMTGDGKLLLARRRGGLGVASASGTFGYAAAGNLDWSDGLKRALDSKPGHHALVDQGIGVEAHEELGVASRFVNPRELFASSMQALAYSELGLAPNEVSISPIGLARDASHNGLVQASYFIATPLAAMDVVKRMVGSPDAKKEYDMVLAVQMNEPNIRRILENGGLANGVNFNVETRSSLAQLVGQEHGRALLNRPASRE